MTLEEIKSAYQFIKEAIEGYKSRGENVPICVYERLIELANELIKIREG